MRALARVIPLHCLFLAFILAASAAKAQDHTVTGITFTGANGRTTLYVGETVEFTATVTPVRGGVRVTYTVRNLADNSVYYTGVYRTNGNGEAKLTLIARVPGRYQIEAACIGQNPPVSVGPFTVMRLHHVEGKRTGEDDAVFDEDPGTFCDDDTLNGRVIMEPANPANPPVGWVLQKSGILSWSDTGSGAGTSFAGQGFNGTGTYRLIFYFDTNGDGTFNDPFIGTTEPYVVSRRFEVVTPTVHNLTISRHVDVAITNAEADAMLADGTDRLRTRNRIDDVRCCVRLVRNGNIGTFGTAGSPANTPPSTINTAAEEDRVFGVNANIKIVAAINYCGRAVAANGCTRRGRHNTILRNGVNGATWAHEFGHAQGIVGDYTDVARNHRIMFFQGNDFKNTVDTTECASYRN